MKNTLFVLFFLFCVASAFGQTSAPVLPNVSAPMIMSEHPQHASQHDMAQEQSLFGSNTPYSYAQGEQPLWQFPSDKRVTPLGDVARSLRKEHEAARKAEIIWENE
jgi:hypothetical protein